MICSAPPLFPLGRLVPALVSVSRQSRSHKAGQDLLRCFGEIVSLDNQLVIRTANPRGLHHYTGPAAELAAAVLVPVALLEEPGILAVARIAEREEARAVGIGAEALREPAAAPAVFGQEAGRRKP